MDDCIVFCEVWGAKEYILIGCTFFAGFIVAGLAAYNGADIKDSVASGIIGLLVTFGILMVVFNIPMIIIGIGAVIGIGIVIGRAMHRFEQGNDGNG